jgi:hypothetical protein
MNAMPPLRLTMLPRDQRGHTIFARRRCAGYILHLRRGDGPLREYNNEPMTALGVLEAIEWTTSPDIRIATSYVVTEACACD